MPSVACTHGAPRLLACARACLSLLAMLCLCRPAAAIRPAFSWDTLGNMTFFHSCNESGLFSEQALDTIQKFPFVTIEKGQGFLDGSAACTATAGVCAEEKILAQIKAVKARDPTIATVFYMNAVLDWYFYRMHYEMLQHPTWALRCSKGPDDAHTQKPTCPQGVFHTSGDRTFNPPAGGMLVFDDREPAVRAFWLAACFKAVSSGAVDGCFSDSSNVGTHATDKVLNVSANATYEAGKVSTMTQATARFGGTAGRPYPSSANGVLIGKHPSQLGINAIQIEMFDSSEEQILVLMDSVRRGYLTQAHVAVHNLPVTNHGCAHMLDTAAAFLIGAGPNCYFGSGLWIASGLADVEGRWCPALFERPLGEPKALAVKNAAGVYTREFKSGTKVSFDTRTNKGTIQWGGVKSN